MRVRRVTFFGLLILTTTTATAACGSSDVSGPPTGRSSVASREPSSGVPSTTVGQPSGAPTAAPPSTEAPSPSATLPPTGDDDPDATFDPGDPFGVPRARYLSGTATMTIGDQVLTLDRLAAPGTLFKEFGADVIWANDDGWYIQLGGGKANPGPTDDPAYISLDRVTHGQHWISWDPVGCRISVLEADTVGVRGTASCSNMQWVDAIAGGMAEEPTPIAGQAPFGAEITFLATP